MCRVQTLYNLWVFVSVISIYRISAFIHPRKVNRAHFLLLQQHTHTGHIHSWKLQSAFASSCCPLSCSTVAAEGQTSGSRALKLWPVTEGRASRWESDSCLNFCETSRMYFWLLWCDMLLGIKWMHLQSSRMSQTDRLHCYLWICFCTKESLAWGLNTIRYAECKCALCVLCVNASWYQCDL